MTRGVTYEYACAACGESAEKVRLRKRRNKPFKCSCGGVMTREFSTPNILTGAAAEPRSSTPPVARRGFRTAIKLEEDAIGTRLRNVGITGAEVGIDVAPGASVDLDGVHFHRTPTGVRARGAKVTGRNVTYD